jgi:hypothetical protein
MTANCRDAYPDRAAKRYTRALRRGFLKPVVLAAVLVAVGAAGTLAYQAMQGSLGSPTGSTVTPGACAPAPCATVQGFTLWVSDMSATGDLVTMKVKFKNSSAATHASPEDLQLIDATGHSSGLTTAQAGCTTWSRHEFGNGATFGPVSICFRVTDTAGPLKLRWSPDLGFFCCVTDLTLP